MSVRTDSDEPLWTDLQEALGEGDPHRVRTLIEGGGDIRYKRERGYDALIDAVHGRDVVSDSRLLDLLRLLVAHGTDLSGVSEYGESGLRVLSRIGRFDGVRLLLDAGADRDHLEWTRLHEAVALGTPADVAAALDAGEPLEARDWWSRTAWLVALLMGDLAKAELLLKRGADLTARGRCGQPPLFYAIQGRHPGVVHWLLQHGADVHQADEFGRTALMEAVAADELESVELLLAAGADVGVDANGTALSLGQSRAVILRLLEAGADPADLGCGGQRIVLRLPPFGDGSRLATVSPDEFRRAWSRRFGAANPERMRKPFWEAMVRAGVSAYTGGRRFAPDRDPGAGPVWCADRFGQSLTLLQDDRAVQVGGEHEDHYDPDFCIYNDVFVHGTGGDLAIYGYPWEVFPPTDFHTATLFGDAIYLIGSLGYAGTRQYGETPVYRLDLQTFRMDRLAVGGDAPGWIYGHRAEASGAATIRVWAGKTVTCAAGTECHDPNPDTFVLDLSRFRWSRESAHRPVPAEAGPVATREGGAAEPRGAPDLGGGKFAALKSPRRRGR